MGYERTKESRSIVHNRFLVTRKNVLDQRFEAFPTKEEGAKRTETETRGERERESECERGGEGLREGEGGAEVERGIGRAGEREGGRETDRISPFPCLPPSSHPPSFTALVVSSKYFYVPTISYTLPLYTLYIYLSGIYAYLYACTSGPAIHRSERHIKST